MKPKELFLVTTEEIILPPNGGCNNSNSNNDPNPVFIIKNLEDQDAISKDINLLRGKSGIYCFINNTNDKRYIGSAKDLYLRFQEHNIKNRRYYSSKVQQALHEK